MTYSHMGEPHYHRRWSVSRLSSGWDQVVPDRYDRQAKRMITGKDEIKRDGDFFELAFALLLRYPQLSWVLYSQAARAISIG